MTLTGAIRELHELRCAEDMPIYYKPVIAEVINVLLMDTQEVKHGRWIVNNETKEWVTIYCDQCHDGMWNRKYDPFPNYCFNCGAKMDEVEE